MCTSDLAFSQCDTNCSISCSGQINLSLGSGCQSVITPWMGGKSVPVGDTTCYSVAVYDAHNRPIPGNLVDINHVGKNLTYKVTELECNNFCWGNILIEYKNGPQLACPPDMTLDCGTLELFELPVPEDLCAAVSIELIREEQRLLECDEDLQSAVTRTYRAVDEFGNTNTCSHDIFLRRIPISEIIFPGNTKIQCSDPNILFDVNGFPLPFFFNTGVDSTSVFSVPFICSSTVPSPYICPGSGIPAINDCGTIITSLDDMGMVTIGLSLTNPNVSASCISGDFNLSFSSTSIVSSIDFDCTSLGVNQYVIHLLDGTTSVATCTNTVEIVDATGFCGGTGGGGTGSGTGSGTPGGPIPGPGGGTTTTTGGGTTTNTGAGGGCAYGVPIFPTGGGVIITPTGDVFKPFDVQVVDESNTGFLCGAVLLFNDVEFPTKNSCTRKIFRTWEAIEWWCDEEFQTSSVQIIEIVDDRAPEFVCPSDLTISTTRDCAANTTMPLIETFDECGSEVTVTMIMEDGLSYPGGGLVDLNAGVNQVEFVVSDVCNNSSSCFAKFTVIDYNSPVAICERNKVISLGNNAVTRLPADLFDNGSYDDCAIDKMLVRRQHAFCGEDTNEFGEYASFCCADVQAGEVAVEFRVVDKGGNVGDCITYVEIQDKANPIINCPPDMTIDCRDSYSSSNMSQTFGSPTFSDNCTETEPIELVDDGFDQCGLGAMTRTLQIHDNQGNVIAQCQQKITVANENPFSADLIIWPQDLEVSNICDLDLLLPDNLDQPHAFPTFGNEECALLGFDFEDSVFSADPTSGDCAIIQRTWTVLNWCGADGDFDTYVIPQPQLITVRNEVAPVIDLAGDVVFSGINVDCNSGQIDIVRTAIDDCDNSLTWQFVIRRNLDAAIVHQGNSNEIRGKFPVGNYSIEWTVRDDCGNFDSHIQGMRIVSDKSPTPLCHNGISTTLIGWDTDGDGQIDTERVELKASDFDAGSYPNCNNPITFSFSADTTDNNIVFDCGDVGTRQVQMWVTDRVTGAQDFCIATVDVQDTGDCGPIGVIVTVAGRVFTESEQEIENVEVHANPTPQMEMTDRVGAYAFPTLSTGLDYDIEPHKDIEHHEGISTLDLIMIQRHILGIESLDSPYKLLAADINSDQRIDGVDLVELRKLILGIYTELPDNDSWRFVSSDHIFVDETDPWMGFLPETYTIAGLNRNKVVDFIGVKVGDVNNTMDAGFAGLVAPRSYSTVELYSMPNSSIKQNKGSLLIYSDNYNDLLGWQGALNVDCDGCAIAELVPHQMNILPSQYHVDSRSGQVTVSYHAGGGLDSFDPNEPLFEIVLQGSGIDDARLFFEDALPSEAYEEDRTSSQITFVDRDRVKAEILSVTPNPFVEEAMINYALPHSGDVKFSFHDINGRLLHSRRIEGEQGLNSVNILRTDLSVTGFVFIRMQFENQIFEHKMIIL